VPHEPQHGGRGRLWPDEEALLTRLMTERQPTDPASPATGPSPSDPRPTFAHASEAELSRILDFYEVRWEYEPHVFPILWTLDGAVAESFAPDFFLPDLDLYVELTTLRQPLVRKKNRKLRRLRELYPDVRIKLFYARDFRALMLKYGKVGLADGLSGSLGQVVPAAADPAPPGAAAELSAASAAPIGSASADAAAAGPGSLSVAPDPAPIAVLGSATAPATATVRSAASRRNARRSRRRHAAASETGSVLRATAAAGPLGAGSVAETMR
jgi:hypothetical protein